MKILIRLIKCFVLSLVLILTACGHTNIEHYKDTLPELKFEQFFDGELKAYGIVLGRSGELKRRFEVTMIAQWQGDKGEIKEWFIFDDGEKMTRIWQLQKLGENRFQGTAGDVIGLAQGETQGAALYWKYVLEVPVDGTTYHITLDDWMFLIDGKRLFNKTKMSKWGIDVGEVIIYIEKI